jgi:predicted deacetylase
MPGRCTNKIVEACQKPKKKMLVAPNFHPKVTLPVCQDTVISILVIIDIGLNRVPYFGHLPYHAPVRMPGRCTNKIVEACQKPKKKTLVAPNFHPKVILLV